jgi:hypothetical protein
VLLKPREVKPLLDAIHQAAVGAGESEATMAALQEMIAGIANTAPGDYLTFGFDPWTG